jgi:predicted AlkP superfamily phosphohydrolase/phosphomutase
MTPKVILFGLDGATYTVLDDLMARGLMPNLVKFCQEGVRTTMMSSIPPLTPPAWSTLVTGRSPGHHGVLCFLQYANAASSSVQIVSSRQLTEPTLWAMVNKQGVRSGSLNFVAHNPAPKIDGWVIPGWVSWRWMRTLSHPSGVIDQLKKEVPGFDVKSLALDFEEETKAVAGAELDEYGSWIDLHLDRERQWFNAAKYLLKTDPVGLFGIVFDGVDKLQHLLWHYLDPAMAPENPSPEFLKVRELAWSYFRQIDDLLGETVRTWGDEATIMICSDHGFTNSWEILYINAWLAQRGYLAWGEDEPTQEEGTLQLEGKFYGLKGFDMANTKAYCLTTTSNGIYINVKGQRDETGIPPEEYTALRDEIKHKLLTDCKDPETGEPLITGIWTREEAFSGPHMENAPDLTVELRDFGFISVRRTNSIYAKRPRVMGTHHPKGILVARGPGIRSQAEAGTVHLKDVAPTTLYCMDLEIPAGLEGRVIEDLFTPEFLAARKPKHAGAAATEPIKLVPSEHGVNGTAERSINGAEGASEEDQDILDKMKALGYLE